MDQLVIPLPNLARNKHFDFKHTFSSGEHIFMKNFLTKIFSKKSNFTSLFKQAVHLFNKSYIDFAGSNNPKGENNESNGAKEEIIFL